MRSLALRSPVLRPLVLRPLALRFLAATVTSFALAGSAAAGQVFVNVNNNFFQNPSVATLNSGDVVVWRWIGSGHTVTSGTSGTAAGDGTFNSNPTGAGQGVGTLFSWKTGSNASYSYYCFPHFFANMKGTIVVGVSVTQEADFRITEVRFNAGAQNFVEIANLGDADGDLGGFRLSINGNAPLTPWPVGTIVAAGTRVAVSNPAGLSTSGSVALYAPNNTAAGSPSSSLLDASMMLDYVEWGIAGGQALETTADATTQPKVWTAGEFVPQVADGHSIAFCGTRFFYGSSFWYGVMTPTPGTTNDCPNPTFTITWGRIKTLYR